MLDADDGLAEQDFLMVNGPVFTAAAAKQLLRNLKLLAATTDKAPQAKKILSAALRGLESLVVDIEKMPLEDASVEWPQDLSPSVAVARVHVPAKATWEPEHSPQKDDRLSFSPWRGLGSIMQVRRAAYPAAARYRQAFNAGEIRGEEEGKSISE